MTRRILPELGQLILCLALMCAPAAAQQTNLSCSLTSVPFTQSQFPGVAETHSSSGLSSWPSCTLGGNCPARVVDASLSNFARGSIALTGSLTIAVADAGNTYSAGNYAGFLLDGSGLNLNLLSAVTVTTYLNATVQESYSGSSLLALSSSLLTNGREIGFYTNKTFNKIELTIGSGIGVGSYDVYYAVLRGTGSCTTPALSCNVNTALSFPTHPVIVDDLLTGVTGAVSISSITNTGNATDADASSYASISTLLNAVGTASFAVRNVTGTYAAGTLAGFDIENATLLNANALGYLTIRTYKDGVLREQKSGTGLVIGATLLGSTGRQLAGFVTTLAYDEIQLEINQTAALSLGATNVYGAVVRQFCAGPVLSCNTSVSVDQSQYPVYINGLRTGFSGVACAACGLYGTGNIIDGDATTYGVVDMTVGAISTGRVAIKDALTDYTAGTFVAFDIENTALLNLSVLDNIRVVTYLDGVQQQSVSGSALVAGVGTDLFGTTGRMTIGALTTTSFDEVVLELDQTASVTLGITKVYGLQLNKFCEGTVGCNSFYWLNSDAYPVYVNARNTGVSGIACVGCNVSNTGNVLTNSLSDYAQLATVANVLASSSLAVRDAVSTYPAGTLAGFSIADPDLLLEATLFQSIRVSTYRQGVLQETKSAGQLLDLSILIPVFSPATGRYLVGFRTSQPFDEIKISVTPVAGVAPSIRVYGVFIDTRYVDALTNLQLCAQPPVADPDHALTLVNTAYTGSVRTNDHDPYNTALTYTTTALTAPAHGGVTISGGGAFTYTPNANFTGIDSFRYRVCNTAALCDTQWAYITVVSAPANAGANTAPVAQHDFAETTSGGTVAGNARSNDADADGNTLHYTVSSTTQHGNLVMNENGSYSYTANSSFAGVDTATISVCDDFNPAACTSSLLVITVVPPADGGANTRPNAHDDLLLTPAGTTGTGNLLSNDNDPDGNPLTATLLDTPSATAGTLTVGSNGDYTFVPGDGFTGDVVVRYRICDNGSPARCDTATLSITVQPARPVADPDHLAVVTGSSYTGSLATNDRDPQFSTLTYNTTPVTAPAHGSATIGANGSIVYTPSGAYTGIDSLQYQVCNTYGMCTTAWAYITVLPFREPDGANHAPVAQIDYSVTYSGVAVSGNARSNDLEGDGNGLSYALTTQAAHGSLVLNANGSYTYTPSNGFTGNDTAVIQVCDQASPAACVSSLVVITVLDAAAPGVNTRPEAHDDVASTAAGTNVGGNVLSNDTDPDGNTLTATQLGTLSASVGTIVLNSDGSYLFTPAAGFTGTAVVPYRACDGGSPQRCDTATLSIVVQPAAPRAGADHVGTYINTPYSGSLRPNDRDPQQWALTYNTTPVTAPANGFVSIASDGSFTYTPAPAFRGLDSFQYTVCNTFGLCATQWAFISVVDGRTYGGVNYAPVAQPDYNQTVSGGTVGGNASSNDVDADGQPLTYTVITTTPNGSLTLNANGTYSYTAGSNFTGTDTALLQVCDNGSPAACVTSRLYIQVLPATPANNPPVARDDLFATPRATNISGYVMRNDNDPDGDALTAALIDAVAPAAGTIAFASDGGFTFMPASGYTGTVSLRYQICDNGTPSRCDTATLTIVVQQVIGPDFTPTMFFDSTLFTAPGVSRDFYVRISELQNSASNGQVLFRILKPSAFTISYTANATVSQVNGGTAVSNSDWNLSETSSMITATLKPGITLSGSGFSLIGFRIARKSNVAPNTMQSITTSIATGSGGDSNSANNQASVKLTAQ